MTASTRAERALDGAGHTVSAAVAARALGISRNHLYALIQRNEAPVQVLRLGRCIRVPTEPLRRVLTGDPGPAA